jgi:hypothetical protein
LIRQLEKTERHVIISNQAATFFRMIRFLFYGAIAMILRQAKNEGGLTVSHQIVHTFVSQLIPSGGGAIGKRLC